MGWNWLRTHSDPEVREFLARNSELEPWEAVLKIPTDASWSRDYIHAQLEGKKPFQRKFPGLEAQRIIIPPKKAIEQASSEISARWKGQLFKGQKLLDLSAGMGGDLFFLAESFNEAIGVEKDNDLAEVTQHNFKALGSKATVRSGNSLGFLTTMEADSFDLILVDPDRRSGGNRVFRFADSEPLISGRITDLLSKSQRVLIKSSPMLDLDYGMRELGSPTSVRIISIGWECKEVLFFFSRRDNKDDPKVFLDWFSDFKWQSEELDYSDLKLPIRKYRDLGEYVYDPNPSMLKAKAFHWACDRFGLEKIGQNTHLFSSQKPRSDFPGRRLRVLDKGYFKKDQWDNRRSFEVLFRNFPVDKAQVMKEQKIKEGNSEVLIFFSDEMGKKKWAQCEPI